MPEDRISTWKSLSGEWGEWSVMLWLATKYNIECLKPETNTVGFDLIATQKKEFLKGFPVNKRVAIGVKSRIRSEKGFNDTFTWSPKKLFENAKLWESEPYLAISRLTPSKGLYELWLLSYKIALKHSYPNKTRSKKVDKRELNPRNLDNDPAVVKVVKCKFEPFLI